MAAPLQNIWTLDAALPLDPAEPPEFSPPEAPRQQGTAFYKEQKKWDQVVEDLRQVRLLEGLHELARLRKCDNAHVRKKYFDEVLQARESRCAQVEKKLESLRISKESQSEAVEQLLKDKTAFEEGKSEDGGTPRRRYCELQARYWERRLQQFRYQIAQRRNEIESQIISANMTIKRLQMELDQQTKPNSSDEKHRPSVKPAGTDKAQGTHDEEQQSNSTEAANRDGLSESQQEVAAADKGDAEQNQACSTEPHAKDLTTQVQEKKREKEELISIKRELDREEAYRVRLYADRVFYNRNRARILGRQYKKIMKDLYLLKKKQGRLEEQISKGQQEQIDLEKEVDMWKGMRLTALMEDLPRGQGYEHMTPATRKEIKVQWAALHAAFGVDPKEEDYNQFSRKFETALNAKFEQHQKAAREMAQSHARHRGLDVSALCPNGDDSILDELLETCYLMLDHLPKVKSVLDFDPVKDGEITDDEHEDSDSETDSDDSESDVHSDKSSNNTPDVETDNTSGGIVEQEQHNEEDGEERTTEQQDTGDTVAVPDTTNGDNSKPSDDPSQPEGWDQLYRKINEGMTDEVRLLLVYPAPSQHFPIICELQTVELMNRFDIPKYAALSYWWGSPEDRQSVYMLPTNQARSHERGSRPQPYTGRDQIGEAVKVSVYMNLYCALNRLRCRDKPVLLWVDSLCINQLDDEEKSHQLNAMMSKIYSSAEKVCVWLGESSDDGNGDKAMDFIPKVVDMAAIQGLLKDSSAAENWEALAVLMRDQWFSRRWVVQEILLARKAVVHCGTRKVLWADFVDAITLLVHNQDAVRGLFRQERWYYGPETIGDVKKSSAVKLLDVTNDLFMRAPDGTVRESRKSLEFLVTSLTTFGTTDARDLVYSLIHIANDTKNLSSDPFRGGTHADVSGGVSRIPIDYTKATVKVCIDFAKFCIEGSESLDIICRHWAIKGETKHDNPDTVYPSWIPMLQNSEFGEPGEARWGRKNGISFVGLQGQRRYNAAAGRPARRKSVVFKDRKSLRELEGYDEKIEGGVLVPLGFMLGKVREVSPVMKAGLISSESLLMAGWPGRSRRSKDAPHRTPQRKEASNKEEAIQEKGVNKKGAANKKREANQKKEAKKKREANKKMEANKQDEANRKNQVWRVLIADRDAKTNNAPPSWYKRVCEHCLTVADNLNNGNFNIDMMLLNWQSSPMVKAYLELVRETTWNRRFVSVSLIHDTETKAEHEREEEKDRTMDQKRSDAAAKDAEDPVALCPADTQPGDIICILLGCSVPVVLRPFGTFIAQSRKLAENSALLESENNTHSSATSNNKREAPQRYILIGECYVHGYMDGKVTDEYELNHTASKGLGKKIDGPEDVPDILGGNDTLASGDTGEEDKGQEKTNGEAKKDAQKDEMKNFHVWTQFHIL